MVAELPWLWLRPADRTWARWCSGRAKLRRPGPGRAGRGLVLLTPHLGSFEVSPRPYAERFGASRPGSR
jgi:KDO2-lipid IV(A) lauroyltransferase